jgi:hypothetical protein
LLSREKEWARRVLRRHEASKSPYENLNPVPDNYLAQPQAWRDRTAYDIFEPEWTCALEERIGVPYGDGGKWECSFPPSTPCLVYSVGSNYDFSFENAVARGNPKCEIHTFDPTVEVEKSEKLALEPGALFHSLGVGSEAPKGSPGTVSSFSDIISTLGHSEVDKIDILKIDCEGCEFSHPFLEFFEKCAENNGTTTPRIAQIQLEFHGTSYPAILNTFEIFDKCGYRIFHKERNHW